jgi:hypothetical protein
MGVIHSHLNAALLEQGGEMAVGNSPPLNRAIRAIYKEQDTLNHYDICQITVIFLCNLMCDVTGFNYKIERRGEKSNEKCKTNLRKF